MQFNLADEHTDPEAEARYLAAIAAEPEVYWEATLPPAVFAAHGDTYEAIQEALEADKPAPDLPEDWTAGANPAEDAALLKDLWQRRALAELQQETAALLARRDVPAGEVVAGFVERAAKIEADVTADTAGQLAFPEDLVPDVLQGIEEARQTFEAQGDHVTGVRSGLAGLDNILGGFQAGLNILAGGPGVGKTTFALQIAADASSAGVPVLYVTFENGPESLTEKGICAAGKLNSRDVRRGQASAGDVERAAARWRQKAERLAIIEGRSTLSRGQIRGKARRLMNRFAAERCLIVVDYLQLYAKAAKDLRGLGSLREKVEVMGNELRDVAVRLRCPVLAIASLSRGDNNYDRPTLSSLKESGDIEYSADTVMLLAPDPEGVNMDPAVPLTLRVAKNRHGETGTVPVIFRPDLGSMRPKEQRYGSGRHPGERGNGTPF